jgi:hypothetical protein
MIGIPIAFLAVLGQLKEQALLRRAHRWPLDLGLFERRFWILHRLTIVDRPALPKDKRERFVESDEGGLTSHLY